MSPSSKTARLSFQNCTKQYRDFWLRLNKPALFDFSLDVCAGQIVGLLGPNGSGKSTAIKLAVGLLRPTSGSVQLSGLSPRVAAARRGLGYLPEENANPPWMTARQVLQLAARLQFVPADEVKDRVDHWLEKIDLTSSADRRSLTFSKGMGRRLGLAQCLIGNPAVVILDEPTSGLDPLGTDLVRSILHELKSSGTTVLLSSHLLAEIEDVCDELVVLSKGITLLRGSLDGLLSDSSRHDASIAGPLTADQRSELQAWCKERGLTLESIAPHRISLSEFYRNRMRSPFDQQPQERDHERS